MVVQAVAVQMLELLVLEIPHLLAQAKVITVGRVVQVQETLQAVAVVAQVELGSLGHQQLVETVELELHLQ
jgi:hypothetical protein